jgi:hypothetical protein
MIEKNNASYDELENQRKPIALRVIIGYDKIQYRTKTNEINHMFPELFILVCFEGNINNKTINPKFRNFPCFFNLLFIM